MPNAPRAHQAFLGKISVDQYDGDGIAPDPFTFRHLYLCDSEADIPTNGDVEVLNGDWAFARNEGTQWQRIAGSWSQISGGGAPTGADYLVGTAQGGLSAEIVVGTAPGGELGGTWGAPTVDATHSGSAHHDAVTTTDGEHTVAAQVLSGADAAAAQKGHVQLAGELGGTAAAPTIAATHSGSAHHAQSHGNGDHTSTFITATGVTFENLDANADVGAGATQVAQGSHSHAGAGHTIADAGVAETQRATLDFQDGFIVTDNAGANSTDVDLDYGTGATQPAAGDHTHAGAGHTIQDDDASLTQRANLSFQDGFVLTDDAGGNQSEVDLSYGAAGYPLDVAAAEGDGTAITVARADHVHAHGSGYLADAHHAQSHVLATGTALGPDQTISGAAAGEVLRALSATTAAFDVLQHTDLGGITATQHHSNANDHVQSHVLDPGDHTISGKTAGQFLRATSATAFAFEAVSFSVGAVFDGGTAAPTNGARLVWKAPFACTATNIRGTIDAGTNAIMNAQRRTAGPPGTDLRADVTYTTTSFVDGGALTVTAFAAGDELALELVSTSGAVTKASLQVDFTRP